MLVSVAAFASLSFSARALFCWRSASADSARRAADLAASSSLALPAASSMMSSSVFTFVSLSFSRRFASAIFSAVSSSLRRNAEASARRIRALPASSSMISSSVLAFTSERSFCRIILSIDTRIASSSFFRSAASRRARAAAATGLTARSPRGIYECRQAATLARVASPKESARRLEFGRICVLL